MKHGLPIGSRRVWDIRRAHFFVLKRHRVIINHHIRCFKYCNGVSWKIFNPIETRFLFVSSGLKRPLWATRLPVAFSARWTMMRTCCSLLRPGGSFVFSGSRKAFRNSAGLCWCFYFCVGGCVGCWVRNRTRSKDPEAGLYQALWNSCVPLPKAAKHPKTSKISTRTLRKPRPLQIKTLKSNDQPSHFTSRTRTPEETEQVQLTSEQNNQDQQEPPIKLKKNHVTLNKM